MSDLQLFCGMVKRLRIPLTVVVLGILNVSVYFSRYTSYETHRQEGTVVAAYVEHDDDEFSLEQVISYQRMVDRVSFHRNCSLWKESYGHRSRAQRAAARIELGTKRTVYLPVHDSYHFCVESDDREFYLRAAIFYSVFTFFALLLLLNRCADNGRSRRTGPTTYTVETTEEAATVDLEAPAALAIRPAAAATANGYTSVESKSGEF
jgi:hypothetical protein